MKKEYNIVGLDCGHCALTLEKYLEKVEGVKSCNINFSTSKLFLEIEDENSKAIIKNIFKSAKECNPSVKITEEKGEESGINYIDIILFFIGFIMGLIVIFAPLNPVLYWIMLVISALLMGYKTYYKALLQLKIFKLNENTLVTLSVIGAVAVGEEMEALMVIALYTIGKMLEAKAVRFSRKSISSLISSQPEYACIIADGKENKVKPEVVKIGDKIIVRAGEKVALDGKIVEGNATVDKRHLTGESVPVVVSTGDYIESGSIVLDSMLIIEVTSEYKDSTVSKILQLVSNASSKKSKTETVISKFSSYYTLGVLVLAIITFGISWIVLKDVYTAIYRGLIFLVVSCPCAFAISVPLGYFSGIGRCSRSGILIKGSNYLDAVAKLNYMCFDKTGTLTTGEFVVEDIILEKGVEEDSLLKNVVAGEKHSLHPIAKAICKYYGKDVRVKITDFKEITGKGIEYKIGEDKYTIGRSSDDLGNTSVEIKKNGKKQGVIILADEIKSGNIDLIKDLKVLGVKSVMLTGDKETVAKNVACKLGIDEYRAELMPDDKYKVLQELKDKGYNVGFVGDGINDAPALTLSDVGISMGIKGSDATIESSDVVIADDNISKIPKLINVSRYTKKIVWENIIFSAVTKLTFLVLGALGITGMLLAVFADVGVTLIAILNSLRVLNCHKD